MIDNEQYIVPSKENKKPFAFCYAPPHHVALHLSTDTQFEMVQWLNCLVRSANNTLRKRRPSLIPIVPTSISNTDSATEMLQNHILTGQSGMNSCHGVKKTSLKSIVAKQVRINNSVKYFPARKPVQVRLVQ